MYGEVTGRGFFAGLTMKHRGVKKLILFAGLSATVAALVWMACLFLPTDKKAPHIILISIDTIRADHVSSYGYQYKHPYDGEIAFVDDCIGRIIDKLKSLDLYDDSLIIITISPIGIFSTSASPPPNTRATACSALSTISGIISRRRGRNFITASRTLRN